MAREQGSPQSDDVQDASVSQERDAAPDASADEMPGVDPETAALLRSLEEPPVDTTAPAAESGHIAMYDLSATEPSLPAVIRSGPADVVAYQPINLDVPWTTNSLDSASSWTTQPGIPSIMPPLHMDPLTAPPFADVAPPLAAEPQGIPELASARLAEELAGSASGSDATEDEESTAVARGVAAVVDDPATADSPVAGAVTGDSDIVEALDEAPAGEETALPADADGDEEGERARTPESTAEFFFDDDDDALDDDESIEEIVAVERLQERPKRPPPPPSPPRPPPSKLRRVAKDDEVVMSQAALEDMLPGGRADEARDLSGDFQDNRWYRDIFNEDYFRTLPKNFHRQTLREVQFVVNQLGLEPGARLLDLCCGFGRHTMELAKRGYQMVGLDLAMPLLQKGLNEAQRRNLSIKFVHGDMRELKFQSVFDGVFTIQTSFGYFSDQTNFKVLQGVFRALKPGGRLMIETINRDFIIEELPMRIWWEGTESLILEEIDFDFMSGQLCLKRSFVFEDSTRDPWEQDIRVRMYSAHELSNLLRRAGFEVLELSGDYSYPGAFFGAASQRVIMVAERPVS